MSRLFVSCLPVDTKEKTLRELFSQKGVVTDCSLKFATDGTFRRFAFIGYKTEEEAKAAQKYFNKTYLKSSRILVDFAVDLADKKEKRRSNPSNCNRDNAESKEKSGVEKGVKLKLKATEKNDAMLGELKNDKEFQEFMGAFDPKSRQLWKNSIAANTSLPEVSDEELADVEQKDEKAIVLKNAPVCDSRKGVRMSDIEFLKSKMKLLASDDEEDQEEEEHHYTAKSNSQADQSEKFVLKLKGLPATVKQSAIREFFKPLKVKVTMPKNKNKLSIGIAFVQCSNEKDLQAALIKNKTFIGKKKVFLSRVTEKKAIEKSAEEKPKPWEQKEKALEGEESIAESGRLFVRNLPYECSEEELESIFSKYGPLTDIDVPVDSVTKKTKGYAHVTYLIPEHAVKAFADLDHKGFMGRLMHILPGKDRTPNYVSSEKSSYKRKKDEKTKSLAKSDHNWNTLFLSGDAVASAMATKYGTDKSFVLDDSGAGSIGVRLALGETQLVHETRNFLIENGVALDSFSQAGGKRSKTVILVKDLKAQLSAEDLQTMFSKFGTVSRVVLPPHGCTAIVQFLEPSEAKRAFTKIAYRSFKGQPMYLEWAPMTVFTTETSSTTKNKEMNVEESQEQDTLDYTIKKSDTTQDETQAKSEEFIEPESVLFVKNINFNTDEAKLIEVFRKLGPVKGVSIAKKKDTKNAGNLLSMGYGFVKYTKAAHAKEALKVLQHFEVDGHQLQLKISHKETVQPVTGRKRQVDTAHEDTTKIIVKNIPFQASPKEVTELFKTFGELKFVRVPKKAGGAGIRGFAFVDFATKQDAKRAFDSLCHSTHLYGRRLVLEWAETAETVEDLQRKTAQTFYSGPTKRKLRKKSIVEALE